MLTKRFDWNCNCIQITLDGNFSNDGPSVSRRLGKVPLAVNGDGSVHPKLFSSSTRDVVVSNEYGCIEFGSIDWDDVDIADVDVDNAPAPVANLAVASESAALAYDRQVRPSWSVCLMLALFCCGGENDWIRRLLGMDRDVVNLPRLIIEPSRDCPLHMPDAMKCEDHVHLQSHSHHRWSIVPVLAPTLSYPTY